MEPCTRRRDGKPFWGCTKFRKTGCKGSEDYETPGDEPAGSSVEPVTRSASDRSSSMPVAWADRVVRQGWIAEYTTIGSLAGFARNDVDLTDDVLSRTLSQTYFLTTRSKDRTPNQNARLIGSLLSKILQRGRTPLPTLGVENAALKDHELSDWVVELPENDPELGFQLSKSFKGKVSRTSTIEIISTRGAFRIDDEFELGTESEVPLFDSDYEERFLTEWVPRQLGPVAANWFLPQVSLDSIYEASGFSDTGVSDVSAYGTS